MRGECNKRPVIIKWPNNTESYCDSLNDAADMLGVKRDCVSKSLQIGHIRSVKNIEIKYA